MIIKGIFSKTSKAFIITARSIDKWYRNWGLSAKLFFILFLTEVSILLILQWNNLKRTENVLYTQSLNNSQVALVRTDQFFDSYMDNIYNTLTLIASQKQLFDVGSDSEAIEQLRLYGERNSLFIKTLYIIRNDERVLCSKGLLYDIIGNADIIKVYQETISDPFGVSWTEPYQTPLSNLTVAFTLPVRDTNNQIIGVVIAEASLDYLNQGISSLLSAEGNKSYILSSPGNQIIVFGSSDGYLPYNKEVYPNTIKNDFYNILLRKTNKVSIIKYKEQTFQCLKSNNNKLGWDFFIIVNQEDYYLSLARLYKSFTLNVLFGVGVLIIGSLLLSIFFTKPIRKLANRMDQVINLEDLPLITIERGDEIGRLSKSYNDMMERINALIKEIKASEVQKKEYELKMLQSQIGPHFLYNTLACINSLAKQQKVDQVQETIHSLVALLSFSFDKEKDEYINLEAELKSIYMYVNIQKVRYGNIFELKVDACQDVLYCKVPKFTLQPIIENAIFHGIVPKGRYGLITVKAYKVRGSLKIAIKDNGIGIGRTERNNLLYRNTAKRISDRFNSIGIHNVNERIKICFGEGYGLKITSILGKGTIIRINIPAGS